VEYKEYRIQSGLGNTILGHFSYRPLYETDPKFQDMAWKLPEASDLELEEADDLVS